MTTKVKFYCAIALFFEFVATQPQPVELHRYSGRYYNRPIAEPVYQPNPSQPFQNHNQHNGPSIYNAPTQKYQQHLNPQNRNRYFNSNQQRFPAIGQGILNNRFSNPVYALNQHPRNHQVNENWSVGNNKQIIPATPISQLRPEQMIPSIPAVPVRDPYLRQNEGLSKSYHQLKNLEKEIPIIKPAPVSVHNANIELPSIQNRYLARASNPVEPKPVRRIPLSLNIERYLMQPRIKDILVKTKQQKRYLVIHPDGRVEHVDKIESVAQKHPKYVLVNAGDIMPKINKPKIGNAAPLQTQPPINLLNSNKAAPLVHEDKVAIVQKPMEKLKPVEPEVNIASSPDIIESRSITGANAITFPTSVTAPITTVPSIQVSSLEIKKEVLPVQETDNVAVKSEPLSNSVVLNSGPAIDDTKRTLANSELISKDKNSSNITVDIEPAPPTISANNAIVSPSVKTEKGSSDEEISTEKPVPQSKKEPSANNSQVILKEVSVTAPATTESSIQFSNLEIKKEVLPAQETDDVAVKLEPPNNAVVINSGPLIDDAKRTLANSELVSNDKSPLNITVESKPAPPTIRDNNAIVIPSVETEKGSSYRKKSTEKPVPQSDKEPKANNSKVILNEVPVIAPTTAKSSIELSNLEIKKEVLPAQETDDVAVKLELPNNAEVMNSGPSIDYTKRTLANSEQISKDKNPINFTMDSEPAPSVIDANYVTVIPSLEKEKSASNRDVTTEKVDPQSDKEPSDNTSQVILEEETNNPIIESIAATSTPANEINVNSQTDLPTGLECSNTTELVLPNVNQFNTDESISVTGTPLPQSSNKTETESASVVSSSNDGKLAPPQAPESNVATAPIVPINEKLDDIDEYIIEEAGAVVLPDQVVPNFGDLDISKSPNKPVLWFRTTDPDFWKKLQLNDVLDVVYFFQIHNQPRIEKDVKTTVFPNGTILEDITQTSWEFEGDEPKITKTTKIINPDDNQ